MAARILLSMFLLVATTTAQAKPNDISTGVYSDGLLMGFDPATGIVSGYFQSETGEGQYSCIFYLSGKLSGPRSPISTYFPEEPADDLIKGELVLETSEKLQVRLQSEHGGCWNVRHFADKEEPAEFNLDSAHGWTRIAVVKSKRAYLFSDPTSANQRKAYVVKGDGVGVRATKPGWLQIDYIDPDGKAVSGWIRQTDVYTPN